MSTLEHIQSTRHVTLQFLGCLDCGTEEGLAYFCCRGARCETHDRTHRNEDERDPVPDLLRFQGGPFEHEDLVAPAWPPPETIQVEGHEDGEYVMLRRSELPDDRSPLLVRGAEYDWKEFA